jgi:hypothetical protein
MLARAPDASLTGERNARRYCAIRQEIAFFHEDAKTKIVFVQWSAQLSSRLVFGSPLAEA